ncbi:MAG TPA: hypothetical protein VMV03_12135 [Spirochaetia bacterium]|nr:hypothetical protein [Spirochaetia bacterium]
MPERSAVSDLLLEQFILGELPADQAERIRSELDRDPALRARRDAIQSSDREILNRYPPSQVAGAIREKLLRERPTQGRDSRTLPFVIGLPAAAALLVFLSLFVIRERLPVSDARMKGLSTHLAVFRKTAQGAEELRSGSLAGKGEIIQLSYTAGEARYGVILSVDGRGATTWHLPPGYRGGPRSAPALDRQAQVILPAAYELDDAPGFERFFFVSASTPFDVAEVARAAHMIASRAGSADAAQLSLPSGLSQVSLLLKKKGPGP